MNFAGLRDRTFKCSSHLYNWTFYFNFSHISQFLYFYQKSKKKNLFLKVLFF